LSTKTLYNKDYYENGIEKGISGYTNYRWIPELTIPLAYRIIKHLDIEDDAVVLDYGCAKGFLVKALRLLGVQAYGYDVSSYAVSMAPKDVSKFIFKNKDYVMRHSYEWIIAKDVFEHLDRIELTSTLRFLSHISNKLFCIVPLAKNGKYVAQANEMDTTHKIRENFEWWKKVLTNFGNRVSGTTEDNGDLKSRYINNPESHGFYLVSKEN
jgi:2-polyprenyl-3-methyl-5-hydroxy-6-metoxy-1,4-benzoquinol methylase